MALVVKNLPVNEGDIRDSGSIPRSGRSPGGGHGNPLQYFCLENLMDRGAWQATVDGVTRVGHDLATKPPTTCMKCSLGSLYWRDLIFFILLFSSISFHWSLRKAFLSLLAILWHSAFKWYIFPFSLLFTSLLFPAVRKASSGFNHGLLYNVTNFCP